jgi:hypothetical protein
MNDAINQGISKIKEGVPRVATMDCRFCGGNEGEFFRSDYFDYFVHTDCVKDKVKLEPLSLEGQILMCELNYAKREK